MNNFQYIHIRFWLEKSSVLFYYLLWLSLLKNKSVVDLHCCVWFSCTENWFTYIYVYLHIFIYLFNLYMCMHIHAYIYIYFFRILFCYRLSQNIQYTFLGYKVGPYWLSILYIVVCVNSKLLIYSLHSPLVTIKLFFMFVSLFLFCKCSFASFF